MCDLLWSDPEDSSNDWGMSPRGAEYLFKFDVVKVFLLFLRHLFGSCLVFYDESVYFVVVYAHTFVGKKCWNEKKVIFWL